jgi:integrase
MPISTDDKRTRNRKLTDARVKALKPGLWLTESWGYGEGALQVRATAKGPRYFYRYGPKQERIPLPSFNEDGGALTLAQARTAARALCARYQSGDKNLKAVLEAEQRERERQHEADKRAEEAAQTRQTATLGALLTTYADLLEKAGKFDFRDVRGAVRLHIEEPFPELWNKPAMDVELADVLDILERLTEAGKLRTAGKVRSYIRAAYAAAINAKRSAQAKALRQFKLKANPAANVSAIEDSSVPRDRHLSVSELRAFWQRVANPDERAGPLLRFYLLTGGQRFKQLARATVSDIADEGLVLWDHKGRRRKVRRHVVPLLPQAVEALEAMASPRVGDFVFTLTNGQTPADHAAVYKRLARICNAMMEAGEASERFTLSDLRRTVETRLAALGVPMDVRAQLQSHGLGGIQARHYDRHDYADEKLEALERLRDLMTEPPASVTKISSKKRKAGNA